MEQQSPNERRLEDWMRTYGTAILRTCFVILSDAREAEDAMQDTFLRAWRAMDTFEQRNGASVKKPLILYYYQDMNLQETADALGISKSTVHTRLKKAEQALKLSLTGGDCYV